MTKTTSDIIEYGGHKSQSTRINLAQLLLLNSEMEVWKYTRSNMQINQANILWTSIQQKKSQISLRSQNKNQCTGTKHNQKCKCFFGLHIKEAIEQEVTYKHSRIQDQSCCQTFLPSTTSSALLHYYLTTSLCTGVHFVSTYNYLFNFYWHGKEWRGGERVS